MVSDIWIKTILIVRKETRCHHIGYSFRLAARVLLDAPSHRQDSTYHGLCYTSCGALVGTRWHGENIEKSQSVQFSGVHLKLIVHHLAVNTSTLLGFASFGLFKTIQINCKFSMSLNHYTCTHFQLFLNNIWA